MLISQSSQIGKGQQKSSIIQREICKISRLPSLKEASKQSGFFVPQGHFNERDIIGYIE